MPETPVQFTELPLTERLLLAEQQADLYKRVYQPTLAQSAAMLGGQALGMVRKPIALPYMSPEMNAANTLYGAYYTSPLLQESRARRASDVGGVVAATVAGVSGNLFGVSQDAQNRMVAAGKSTAGGIAGSMFAQSDFGQSLFGGNLIDMSERLFAQRHRVSTTVGTHVNPFDMDGQGRASLYSSALMDKFMQRTFTHTDPVTGVTQGSVIPNLQATGGLSSGQSATVMAAMIGAGSAFSKGDGTKFNMRGASTSIDEKLRAVTDFSGVMKGMMETLETPEIGEAMNAMDQLTGGATFNIDPARLKGLVDKLQATARLYGTVPKVLFQGAVAMSQAYNSATGNVDRFTGEVTNGEAGARMGVAAMTEAARISHATGKDMHQVMAGVSREMLGAASSSLGMTMHVFGGLAATGAVSAEEFAQVSSMLENPQQDPRKVVDTINRITRRATGTDATALAQDPEELRKAHEALARNPELQDALRDTNTRAYQNERGARAIATASSRMNGMLTQAYADIREAGGGPVSARTYMSAGREDAVRKEAATAYFDAQVETAVYNGDKVGEDRARRQAGKFHEALATGAGMDDLALQLSGDREMAPALKSVRLQGNIAVNSAIAEEMHKRGDISATARRGLVTQGALAKVFTQSASAEDAALRLNITGAAAGLVTNVLTDTRDPVTGASVSMADKVATALTYNNNIIARSLGADKAGAELLTGLDADPREGEDDGAVFARRQAAAAGVIRMLSENASVDAGLRKQIKLMTGSDADARVALVTRMKAFNTLSEDEQKSLLSEVQNFQGMQPAEQEKLRGELSRFNELNPSAQLDLVERMKLPGAPSPAVLEEVRAEATRAMQVSQDGVAGLGVLGKSAMTPAERRDAAEREAGLREADVLARREASVLGYNGPQRLVAWAQGMRKPDGESVSLLDVMGIVETDKDAPALRALSARDLATMSDSEFNSVSAGMSDAQAKELAKIRTQTAELAELGGLDAKTSSKDDLVDKLATMQIEDMTGEKVGGWFNGSTALQKKRKERLLADGITADDAAAQIAEIQKERKTLRDADKAKKLTGTLTIIDGDRRYTATLDGES